MEQEKWTSCILNSIESLNKVEPSPYLYSKIKSRLKGQPEEISIPRVVFTFSTLSIFVLVSFLIINPDLKKIKQKEEIEILMQEQISNSDQLY
jgi:hypothetical protein